MPNLIKIQEVEVGQIKKKPPCHRMIQFAGIIKRFGYHSFDFSIYQFFIFSLTLIDAFNHSHGCPQSAGYSYETYHDLF